MARSENNLKSNITSVAERDCGGSHLTIEARVNTVRAFADHLREAGYGNLKSVDQIRTKHIQSYANSLEGNVSVRTVANRMSHIRAVVEAAGKGQMLHEPALANKELGASGGSRIGTKEPMTAEAYEKHHAAVLEKSPGAAAVMELQRALGLRVNEAVRGAEKENLEKWQRQLQTGHDKVVSIVDGTKGGRGRETLVHGYERALSAVSAALGIANGNKDGFVLTGRNAQQAYDHMGNTYKAVGMGGKEASHSMRYAWAREQTEAYRKGGMGDRQALKELSQDLGHGDGRGRYVAMIYDRKVG
jgi:integrase